MATRSKAVLIEYARSAAADAGMDPDEAVRLLEEATAFDPDRLIAATEGDADELYEAIDVLVGKMQAGVGISVTPADETTAAVRGAEEPYPEGDPNYAGSPGATAGPAPWEGTPETVREGGGGPDDDAPGVVSRSGTPPRPLTREERAEQTRRDLAAQTAVDEGQPGALKPRIRSLREIIGLTTPGQMPEYGRMSGAELEKYVPLGANDPQAATNLMRLMGYEPNQGNPNVAFLESLIPGLGRQSDIQRRLEGGYALGSYPEEMSEEERSLKGQEARMRLLGDVSGTMGTGATSAVSPGQGLGLLEQLNTKVNTPSDEEDLTGLRSQFGGPAKNEREARDIGGDAWNVVLDMVGGGLSPYFMGNRGLRQRTLERMWEDYQNRGTENGGSFLNYLVEKLRGTGKGTKPLAATVGVQ